MGFSAESGINCISSVPLAALMAAQLSVYCKLFHMSAVVKQPEQEQEQGTITTQDAREGE